MGAETAAGAAAGVAAGEAAGEAAGAVAAVAIQITGNGERVAKDRQNHRPWPVVLALHRPLSLLGDGGGQTRHSVVKSPPVLRF